MSVLKKGYKYLFTALEWFAMICMVIMVIVVFIEVILRYLFGTGFKWSQEIPTLMMVWFGFIGIAIGVIEKIHISIEFFTMKLPKKITQTMDRANYLIIAIFGGYMIHYGIQIMRLTSKTTLPATKWPSAVLYLILPLSGVLILINGILIAVGLDRKFMDFLISDDSLREE